MCVFRCEFVKASSLSGKNEGNRRRSGTTVEGLLFSGHVPSILSPKGAFYSSATAV